MYIDDNLKGTQMLTDSDYVKPINIGSSELVTIIQLEDIMEEIAGIQLKRSYKLDDPKAVNGCNSDDTLIQRVFGWEPDTKLRVGMEKTYRWIYDEMVTRQCGEVRQSFH
jgi:nucleoside-diphosphate-sugar epimerase